MRRLGPVAPEGADWMHFNNASAALPYLHSPDGGSLTKLAHTHVIRTAKTDGTCDGWAFTMKKPPSSSGASAAPPTSLRNEAFLCGLFFFCWMCRLRP